MFRHFRLLYGLLFGLFLSGSVVASQSEAEVRRTLTVGISETDYYPFYYRNEGEITGAAAEIVTILATQLGYDIRYKRFPWRRVQYNLSLGKIDLVMLYFKTPDRAKDVFYVEQPHLYESSSLITLKGRGIQFSGNLDDLLPFKFGNVNGYWHGAGYSEHPTLLKRQFSTTTELLQVLNRKGIDIAVGNKPVLTQLAKEMGLEERFEFLEPKIDYAPDYIAFSKATQDAELLVKQFSNALDDFLLTPEYTNILKKYGFDLRQN